jgi:recombinational DNA repair ATPase RecF
VLADAWELSHIRDGRAPLLLLDEIAAHLDARRRAALFEEILALGAQAWMTGTDYRCSNGSQARRYFPSRIAANSPGRSDHMSLHPPCPTQRIRRRPSRC